jgi:hypothetical protein
LISTGILALETQTGIEFLELGSDKKGSSEK